MRTWLLSVPLLTICVSGCIARNRVNDNCQWTGDARTRLDIQRSADIRHLMNDATIAEDVAIRYADATRGRRSGHFAGWDDYESTRERCMTSLFAAAADAHNVEARQVRDLLARRPLAVDVPVILAFGALFIAISNAIAGGLLRRFSMEPPTPVIIASLMIAPALSASGLLALGIWAGLIEMIRLGNMHISYRGERVPWGHHSLELFAVGVLVFFSTVALRGYRDRTARRESHAR